MKIEISHRIKKKFLKKNLRTKINIKSHALLKSTYVENRTSSIIHLTCFTHHSIHNQSRRSKLAEKSNKYVHAFQSDIIMGKKKKYTRHHRRFTMLVFFCDSEFTRMLNYFIIEEKPITFGKIFTREFFVTESWTIDYQ